MEDDVRNLEKDLKKIKSKLRVQTHEKALEMAEKNVIDTESQQNSAIFLLEKKMVQMIQQAILPHCIRRTNLSKTWEGKPLNSHLPPCTVLHMLVDVTKEESQAAFNDMADSVQGRFFDTKTLGVRTS